MTNALKIYGNTLEPRHFTRTEAVTAVLDLDLSKEQSKLFKSYVKSKGINFPGPKALLEERKTLKPEIETLSSFDSNKDNELPGELIIFCLRSNTYHQTKKRLPRQLISILKNECPLFIIGEEGARPIPCPFTPFLLQK